MKEQEGDPQSRGAPDQQSAGRMPAPRPQCAFESGCFFLEIGGEHATGEGDLVVTWISLKGGEDSWWELGCKEAVRRREELRSQLDQQRRRGWDQTGKEGIQEGWVDG